MSKPIHPQLRVNTRFTKPARTLATTAFLMLGIAAHAENTAPRPPIDIQAPNEQGMFLRHAQEHAHARSPLLQAIDQDPDNPDLHIQLALTELKLGNHDAAVLAFAVARQVFRNRMDIIFNYAISRAEQGRPDLAAAILNNAVEENIVPDNLKELTLEFLGDAHMEAREHHPAYLVYTDLYELTGKPEHKFKIYLAQEHFAESYNLINELRELRSAVGHQVSILLSRIYIKEGLYEYAVHELLDARERATKALDFEAISNTTLQLAFIHSELGDTKGAIETLTQLHGATYQPRVTTLLAYLYLQDNQPEAAIITLQNNPVDEQRGLLSNAYLAIAGHMSGNTSVLSEAATRLTTTYDGAFPQIAQDYQAHPITHAALIVANHLISAGDSAAARRVLSGINPQTLTPAMHITLGDLNYQLENYAAAEQSYTTALAADLPEDVMLKARKHHALALFALQRYDEARPVLAAYLDEAPHDTEAVYYRAWTHLAKDELAEAKPFLTEAANRGYDKAKSILANHY